MSIEEEILVCAVRYALGRMSYVVGDVCGYVKSKKETLSEHCKDVLIKDIEKDLDTCHRLGIPCGMECDDRDWSELLEVLKGGSHE